MRNWILIFLSVIIFGFISCDNDSPNDRDNSPIANVDIDSYNPMFSENNFLDFYLVGNIKLYFNNNKLTRRVGGFTSPSSGSGMPSYLNDKIYDTIFQNENKITIHKKIIPSEGIISIVPNKKTFLIDNQGKFIYKINYNQEYSENDNDTIYFEYSGSKIIKTYSKNYLNFIDKESLFYYNVNQNLDSIVNKFYVYDSEKDEMILSPTKEKEIFEDYDNTNNPFKTLIIFDDMFKRSLSKNNYRKHTIRVYDTNYQNSYYTKYTKNITPTYDSQGNLIYKLN